MLVRKVSKRGVEFRSLLLSLIGWRADALSAAIMEKDRSRGC